MIDPARLTDMERGTDQQHIEACLGGRSEEFRHLVGQYQRAVFAFLRGRLRQPDRAQEASQETFVRAFFNLAKLKKRESFFPWLLGIAHHVAHETDRKERADRRVCVEYEEQTSQPSETKSRYDSERLRSAVSSLPVPLREVVLLRFYADQSCSQISESLNLPIGTVTKRLSRAYARIRSQIEEQENIHARPRQPRTTYRLG